MDRRCGSPCRSAVCDCCLQPARPPAQSRARGLERHRRAAAPADRPRSQSGGDCEGLCRARTRRLRGSDAKARLEHRGQQRRRAGDGGTGAVGIAQPADGGGGSLSAAQGRQEFSRPANPARGDRRPAPDVAPLLQRGRAQFEHRHPVVSRCPGRAHAGLQGGAVLRARLPRRGARRRKSLSREASHNRDPTPGARVRFPAGRSRAGRMRPSASCCSSATWRWSATAISPSPRPSGSRPRAGKSAAASCAIFPPAIRVPTDRASKWASTVQSVTRNGAVETWATESMANGVRIRIGSSNVTLTRGQHEYVIRYRTTRQIGFFRDYDELYWNATGNGWTFTIDQAEARITLPSAVPFKQSAFYTGPQGAQGKDATVVEQQPGRIVFRTTRPLPPRTGLTVAAGWQKGVVEPPDRASAGWLLARRQHPDRPRRHRQRAAARLLRLRLDQGRPRPHERHHHPAVCVRPTACRRLPCAMSIAWASTIAPSPPPSSISASTGICALSATAMRPPCSAVTGGRAVAPEEKALAASLFRSKHSVQLVQTNHETLGKRQDRSQARG